MNNLSRTSTACLPFEKLGIEHKIEIGNVHRFWKRYNDRPRPIVARFLYHKDLRVVLDQATWLKNTPFGIHQQFPKPIEDKRRKLYPVLKDAKKHGKHAVLMNMLFLRPMAILVGVSGD
jgi:predicted N-formylglutamate amidohydrolase